MNFNNNRPQDVPPKGSDQIKTLRVSCRAHNTRNKVLRITRSVKIYSVYTREGNCAPLPSTKLSSLIRNYR